ncbi:MAG: T9SS type A sorting domain-containing protein [Bacteroidota bacterium]
MKRILQLLLPNFLFIILNASAQSPTIQWAHSFGGSLQDFARCVHQTTDGGFIMAGYTDSHDSDVTGFHGTTNFDDYWVVKTDSLGTLQWQKCLGGTGHDFGYSIAQGIDGGYAITGSSDSQDGDLSTFWGSTDCWLAKLDAGGNLQWQKTLGGTGSDAGHCIQATADGGYIIAATYTYVDTANNLNENYWIVKIDSLGTLQWQHLYGGSSPENAWFIMPTFDQGYIVAGTSSSNDSNVTGNKGGTDCWILKIDSVGEIQWEKSYGSHVNDYCFSITQTKDGGFIFIAQPQGHDSDVSCVGFRDYWLVKLDPSGNMQWQQCFGGSGYDQGYSVIQSSDGGYVVAGFSNSIDGDVTGNHGADYWIIKTDSIGNLEWQKCLGGSSSGETARSIEETSDGGFIVGGDARSNNGDVTDHRGLSGVEDFWLVKLAPLGLSVPVQEEKEFTVYPNPAKESLQLAIPMATENSLQNRTLRILNLIGEEMMAVKVDAEPTTINVKNLASGMYFVAVQTEEGMAIGRFVKE